MLEIRGVEKRFGGVTALESVDLNIPSGSLFSIIGPNGSGKTTLFNTVTSIHRPDAGTILFAGREITGLRAHQVAACGIARTFQNIRVSSELNVLETAMVGLHLKRRRGILAGSLDLPSDRAQAIAAAKNVLERVGLFQKRHLVARSLAPGDQKRLEIARALAMQPRLLLLDEPIGGLNRAEIADILSLIESLRAENITILLIEHDMRVVMSVSDRVAVLKYGRKIAEGSPSEVQKDPAVIEAYLGETVGRTPHIPAGAITNPQPVLQIKNLKVAYDANPVIRGLSLEANKGEVRLILGANGAGKTTILKAIMGVLKPLEGEIDGPGGHAIHGLAPHRIARCGISFCPERRGLLAQMTVRENLEMGAFVKANRAEIEKNMNAAFERFPVLASRQHQLAGSLSGGEQQMLAISRSLMASPQLVLMDEPSVGLAPRIASEIFHSIKEISAGGVAVLLVEQNARQALQIANWAYVLDTGVVVAEGTPADLMRDETIQNAYLGAL